jgi:hypothetical protein
MFSSAMATAGGEPYPDLASYFGEVIGFVILMTPVMTIFAAPLALPFVAALWATSASRNRSWLERVMARVLLLNHVPLLIPFTAWLTFVALEPVSDWSFGLFAQEKPSWIFSPWIPFVASPLVGATLLAPYVLNALLCWRKVREMAPPAAALLLAAAVLLPAACAPPRPVETGGPTGRRLTVEGIELIELSPGRFLMGSDRDDREKPPHLVRIPHPFWIAATEVTNEQYLVLRLHEEADRRLLHGLPSRRDPVGGGIDPSSPQTPRA